MNYAEAEDIVCDGIAKICEALLENGFTNSQIEFFDMEVSNSILFDQIVALVLYAKKQ